MACLTRVRALDLARFGDFPMAGLLCSEGSYHAGPPAMGRSYQIRRGTLSEQVTGLWRIGAPQASNHGCGSPVRNRHRGAM